MSDRLWEYLASEASEYLDQLEGHLSAPGRPDLEQMLRLARGVRGSAQMAGADTLVAVAERLEEGLRTVQAEHIAWSEEIRGLTAGTVADLKVLVRASSRWGRAEEERVRGALARWDELEGVPPGEIVPIEQLFHDDDEPHILSDNGEETMNIDAYSRQEPVPIETLLLDRDAAVAEALAMRATLERLLAEAGSSAAALRAPLAELFELLEIAAEARNGG